MDIVALLYKLLKGLRDLAKSSARWRVIIVGMGTLLTMLAWIWWTSMGIAVLSFREWVKRPAQAPAPEPPAQVHYDAATTSACTGAQGDWRCSLAKPSELEALTGPRPPLVPPAWTVLDWYFDPAIAVTGACASDRNTCTSATCAGGAVGPCVTFAEIVQGRWGGVAPRLQTANQLVTFHVLSSQSNTQQTTDCLVVDPFLGGGFTGSDAGPFGGTFFRLTGVATATSTTTLTAVTPKNRTTPQPLNVTMGTAPATAGETLLVNTTHPSQAFPITAATTTDVTQPCLTSDSNPNSFGCTEVDTWAVSDSITLTTLPRVCVAELHPTILEKGHAEFSGIQVDNIGIAGQAGNTGNQENFGDSAWILWPDVNIVDGYSEKRTRVTGTADKAGIGVVQGSANWMHLGAFTGGWVGESEATASGAQLQGYTIQAGYIPNAASGGEISAFNGVFLDGDVRLKNGQVLTFSGFNFFGQVENDGTIKINQGVIDQQTGNSSTGASPAYGTWGTGSLTAQRGFLYYPAGASGGANTYGGLSGGLKVANTTVGCLTNPSAATTTFTCDLSLGTGANLDTSLAGLSLGGCLGVAGAGICNTTY